MCSCSTREAYITSGGHITREAHITFRVRNTSLQKKTASRLSFFAGAGDEARTRYLHLGKVALYQMSYTRVANVIITNNLRLSRFFYSSMEICFSSVSSCFSSAPAAGSDRTR